MAGQGAQVLADPQHANLLESGCVLREAGGKRKPDARSSCRACEAAFGCAAVVKPVCVVCLTYRTA
ncbi:hypothetical protein BZL43_07960 [Pseudomonas sp. PICF141]|nr:hypothetical protein BZL43_07960 [Pseudomonas sp. PICF141]